MANDGELHLRIGGAADLRPVDVAAADDALRDLEHAANGAGLPRLARLLQRDGHGDRARLGAAMQLSPYLRSTILRFPQWLDQLIDIGADERIRAIVAGLEGQPEPGESDGTMMRRLRRDKLEAALLIALRDLFGAAHCRETTRDLSDLAEAATGAALRFCLVEAHQRGRIRLPDPAQPEAGCGLFVLAMGKLGGGELNYSSDIDLICLFDPDAPAVIDRLESVETFSRIVRRVVRMLNERTGDGYVFRTDLRLRPDPSAMPLAVPVPAALHYYESAGRGWERAAMIKARAIAGDRPAGEEFLGEIVPFVWRRHLDFTAIEEIRAMKQRIDSHRGFDAIGIAGHDLKLGRGGIREIEFFAQTQQLIAGGRAPQLRVLRTEEALRLLADGGWVEPATATRLTDAYWALRRAEHAVQMLADEQSHTLPAREDDLLRIARLLGLPTIEALADQLLGHMRFVDSCFGGMFSDSRHGERGGELGERFGGDDDPDALDRLAGLGFQRPADILRIVETWRAGRYRATRSEAARRHLSRVLGPLLAALAAGRDPDAAVAAFDEFLKGLPAGLQLFSLLASHPPLLDLLALVITAAPRLSQTIAARPHVFDALIDPAFFREVPSPAVLGARLEAFVAVSTGYEDTLARLRIFASEQRFLIGARLLGGSIEGETAAPAYTTLAELVVDTALQAAEAEFAERHGHVAGGRIALLAMGKLGSREMTAGSDLDLILLYDHDPDAEQSDGEKPLPPSVYYTRLTQRLIAALTARMGEGVLYEVDFRLRPSGNKGPLATHIDAFSRYQANEAWTWERMALTRSRCIAGDPDLRAEAEAAIRDLLAARRDPQTLRRDVAAMRQRIDRDKPPSGPLDLKLRAGGVIDLEFLAQWAVLAGVVPLDAVGRATAEVLAAAQGTAEFARLVPSADLAAAARTYTRLVQLVRLGPEQARHVADLPPRLAERVATALDLPSADGLEATLDAVAGRVRAAFAALLPLGAESADGDPRRPAER
ncbi:bifunctional [glutamine synthetase] adenylyltransferase/[glutamine synthetase]-adenylyl-L-tyrosine phosphorylase [Mangrovibrevibacter kandeliae]|uniref:bifunctional [glutamine synthetase] adenylyltransferase/[glutamine synthetase]-adenylyl-L-tyrosine phosphorylase n=1 Tax=Mangrovibrevibacter kandeliae TaxID=2968473 RepID=UPI0021180F1E|nr:bifunctional [glutamine synthetase] adenylyltransferase/[glutamine synthetase]-adenylyl-L-tyrosine phosphorylase [Aurantimonas sp. CSK15Z-1]MCQ8781102.1 bifunctional [glutamine synthetase] adenylyltransferase/[glutamine synthetase]-adenylyl-L-tyrosine phosphorylase [Aurantimonas sp. CSK15Z-1]